MYLSDFLLPCSHFDLLGMVEIPKILIIISEFLQVENTHKKTSLLLGDPSVRLWTMRFCICEIAEWKIVMCLISHMQNCLVKNTYMQFTM
jgi:hypothetical protein